MTADEYYGQPFGDPDETKLEIQRLHEDRADIRHATEIEAARERWQFDIEAHIRMRAFECVKPSLLFTKEGEAADGVDASLVLAEKIARWALGEEL